MAGKWELSGVEDSISGVQMPLQGFDFDGVFDRHQQFARAGVEFFLFGEHLRFQCRRLSKNGFNSCSQIRLTSFRYIQCPCHPVF